MNISARLRKRTVSPKVRQSKIKQLQDSCRSGQFDPQACAKSDLAPASWQFTDPVNKISHLSAPPGIIRRDFRSSPKIEGHGGRLRQNYPSITALQTQDLGKDQNDKSGNARNVVARTADCEFAPIGFSRDRLAKWNTFPDPAIHFSRDSSSRGSLDSMGCRGRRIRIHGDSRG